MCTLKVLRMTCTRRRNKTSFKSIFKKHLCTCICIIYTSNVVYNIYIGLFIHNIRIWFTLLAYLHVAYVVLYWKNFRFFPYVLSDKVKSFLVYILLLCFGWPFRMEMHFINSIIFYLKLNSFQKSWRLVGKT